MNGKWGRAKIKWPTNIFGSIYIIQVHWSSKRSQFNFVNGWNFLKLRFSLEIVVLQKLIAWECSPYKSKLFWTLFCGWNEEKSIILKINLKKKQKINHLLHLTLFRFEFIRIFSFTNYFRFHFMLPSTNIFEYLIK